jgi:integrase
MPLNLYRRHRLECEAGRDEDSRSGEFEERKKTWKRCSCFVFASGTLSGKFRRKNTGQSEWEAARIVTEAWRKAGSWEGETITPAQPIPDPTHRRIETEHATKVFLGELKETAARATQKKYRLMAERLKTFALQRGYAMIDQWEPADVRAFRSTWPVAPPTAVRRMAELKAFFEYCLSNKWITSNPARAVKNPRTRDAADREPQKLPFSDAEIKKMYDACQKYGGTHRHKWKGDDVADFISLSIYTGLRISDVALFRANRMLPTGEIRVRTTKAGTHVYTWVPQWLQDRIRARAGKHGDAVFGQHTTTNLDVITELWRRRLNAVWDACKPWKEKPHPHRFRHTFARILLQKPGVTVRDVAELLGNTEEVVRKHYSAWIPERQARLTKILKEAFDDKPKPKLVSIQR